MSQFLKNVSRGYKILGYHCIFQPSGDIIPVSFDSHYFSLEVSFKSSRDSIEGHLILFVFVFGFQQVYYDVSMCGFSFFCFLTSLLEYNCFTMLY